MNYKNILALTLLVAVLGVFSIIWQRPGEVQGSVAVANEYTATTTDAGWSTATTQCKDTLTSSKVLGSVIVTKTSNATLTVYDATTTASHSNHATTTIASFPLTTVGVYTFDVEVSRGLCVMVDTTVGVASTTITTR